MSGTASTERRKHPRHPLSTSVQLLHGPSGRELPGRCENISAGGLLMHVPATSPVRPGQTVRLNVGSINRPEFERLGEGPVDATIVRVDRNALLAGGHLAIGGRFS